MRGYGTPLDSGIRTTTVGASGDSKKEKLELEWNRKRLENMKRSQSSQPVWEEVQWIKEDSMRVLEGPIVRVSAMNADGVTKARQRPDYDAHQYRPGEDQW